MTLLPPLCVLLPLGIVDDVAAVLGHQLTVTPHLGGASAGWTLPRAPLYQKSVFKVRTSVVNKPNIKELCFASK